MSDAPPNQALFEQQQMLLGALCDAWTSVQANAAIADQQSWPVAQYQRGLQAYRSNAALLAQRVLAAAFPTARRLMGDESFDGLAVHFWRTHPPEKGDLAQWGGELETFLRAIPELMQHEPYLPDVVALEWALHAGQTAADSASADPVPLALIESEFPIVELVGGKNLEDISDIQPERALVYRQGFQTACISIPKDAPI
ncbi:MAG: DNA-binding domain-containing protein [Cytophagales bacterium]|nr:DNA-binding domain-containing protein [Cytophagales bacterium]